MSIYIPSGGLHMCIVIVSECVLLEAAQDVTSAASAKAKQYPCSRCDPPRVLIIGFFFFKRAILHEDAIAMTTFFFVF